MWMLPFPSPQTHANYCKLNVVCASAARASYKASFIIFVNIKYKMQNPDWKFKGFQSAPGDC